MQTKTTTAPAEDQVRRWRRDQLVAAGFRRPLAEEIAEDGGYDLHALIELVERGCPPPLAARILAPARAGDGRVSGLRTDTVALVEPTQQLPARPTPPVLDPESREWLDALRADEAAARDDAIARLHALLLRAAHFEVSRRRPTLPHLRGGDLDDVANQAADDALVSILRRLDDFRGASRFTTWAYKFALYEAAVKLRKRAWQGREVPLEPESWSVFSSAVLAPDAEAEQTELVSAVQAAIAEALTPHQRRVLVALAVNGVPIDVLAERLGTTRGALYKTLHDARRKLRNDLTERGLALEAPEDR